MATKMEQVAFSHKIGASFFLWMPPKNVFLSVFRPLNWGSTKKNRYFVKSIGGRDQNRWAHASMNKMNAEFPVELVHFSKEVQTAKRRKTCKVF